MAREPPAGGRPYWISIEVERIDWEPAFLLLCQEVSCRTIKNSESGLRNSWLKIIIKQDNFIYCLFLKTIMQVNHMFELPPVIMSNRNVLLRHGQAEDPVCLHELRTETESER